MAAAAPDAAAEATPDTGAAAAAAWDAAPEVAVAACEAAPVVAVVAPPNDSATFEAVSCAAVAVASVELALLSAAFAACRPGSIRVAVSAFSHEPLRTEAPGFIHGAVLV